MDHTTNDEELQKDKNSIENSDLAVDIKADSKPHSTPLTLKWLEDNYEKAEGVCIPRSTLYMHYLQFCDVSHSAPVNAASFGKIIRQQFPQLTTRRLGTRGQSKYHYYGIAIREGSPFYDVIYSARSAQVSTEGKIHNTKHTITYSPRSKLGTLLPDFPEPKQLSLTGELDTQKVDTFLTMYKTHCQRILDTVTRANFEEVENFLLHFWQGMPPHLVPILSHVTLVDLVGVCDSILYKAISGVLMPSVLQSLPDSLTQVIRKFSNQLEEWLRSALSGLPNNLIERKVDLSRRFCQVLRRQLSLTHLVQATHSLFTSQDTLAQMSADWKKLDLNAIIKQTLYALDHNSCNAQQIMIKYCGHLQCLLDDQAEIEAYVSCLDELINEAVIQINEKGDKKVERSARNFLLTWSCFCTRIIRDLTLQNAPSFGSFHLLHLMLDDYVTYNVETIYCDFRAKDFLNKVMNGEQSQSDQEDVLPDTKQVLSQNVFPSPSAHFFTGPTLQGLAYLDQFDSDCYSSDEDEDEEDDDNIYDSRSFIFSQNSNLNQTKPLLQQQQMDSNQLLSRNPIQQTYLNQQNWSQQLQTNQVYHPHLRPVENSFHWLPQSRDEGYLRPGVSRYTENLQT